MLPSRPEDHPETTKNYMLQLCVLEGVCEKKYINKKNTIIMH